MKTSDIERDILAFVGEVVRKFFESNDFSSLTPHLSSDIVFATKSGELISQKENVIKAFEQSLFFPCKTEFNDLNVKKLSENLFLTNLNLEIASAQFSGIRKVRVTLIVDSHKRKCEIMYLSFAILADGVSRANVFPIEKKFARKDRGAAREQLLINFLLDGLNNKEIAKRLSLAEITIKKALSKIYQRFGVKNRSELLAKISKK